jgi:hypothetical protein
MTTMDPFETPLPSTVEAVDALGVREVRVCAGCGRPEGQWRENAGEGYALGVALYCCRGCAEEVGCTCG